MLKYLDRIFLKVESGSSSYMDWDPDPFFLAQPCHVFGKSEIGAHVSGNICQLINWSICLDRQKSQICFFFFSEKTYFPSYRLI